MTTSTTAPKTAPRKAAKPKTDTAVAPASDTPEPVVVTTTQPVIGEPDLTKKEFLELVVARSEIKKKDAKPVVEAALAILGEALAGGRGLNLQPLGKPKINRAEDKSNGRIIVCKLRQSLARSDAPKDTIAEAAE